MKTTPGQKLRPSEVRAYRLAQLRSQRNVCPICKTYIKIHEAALDHDHTTGRVRKVLHRQCNSVEGRVLHWLKRNGRTDPETFLKNTLTYWSKDYSMNPEHPNHGKPKRRVKRKRKSTRKKTNG